MKNLCPNCVKGVLAPARGDETIDFNGSRLLVSGIEYSSCPVCGEEVVLPEQVRHNDVLFSDAKRRALGLLTSIDISAFRKRWGLTQQLASQLLGGGVNAFSKYERGETLQSRSMDLLMQVVDRFPHVWAFIEERTSVKVPGYEWEGGVPFENAVAEPNVIYLAARHNPRLSTHFADVPANEDDWQSEPEATYGRC